MFARRQIYLRSAFTLAEMLVVIVILAVLTFVAVEALRPMANQGRFEATRKTLQNVNNAIAGNDTAATRGFVADVGRFPASLDELFGTTLPTDCVPYLPRLAPAPYESIVITSGWRGPYLLAPSGSNLAAQAIQDGWGTPLLAEAVASSAREAVRVYSPPTERNVAAPEYELSDLSTIVEWRPDSLTVWLYKVEAGTKGTPTETGTWRVAVLGPGSVAENGVHVVTSDIVADMDTTNLQFTFTSAQLMAGPHVIQASRDGTLKGPAVHIDLRGGVAHNAEIKVE
ncbi:type II secretion system protein [Anatilimnocola floriformis]|uniref:type II secretion system protein n=1 Tax=Anatilimnocola floriformis TaxID=2948575 RepID=UPI0020C3D124|nr:prepilin-type N-terminal cleavage/methylation domain-containing protein [Anatilimnocola floriformis]